MVTYGSDSFTRSNTSNGTWGTATDSETWSRPYGSATTYAVTSNEGTVSGTPTTWDHFQLGTNNISGTLDVLVRCTVPDTSTCFGVSLRQSTNGQVNYLVVFDAFQSPVGLTLYYENAATYTTVVSPSAFTVTAGHAYWIRGQITGTTLKGKIWADGSGEPGSWTLTGTPGTTITSGGFGIVANANGTTKFDSFTASDGSTGSTTSVTETNAVSESLSAKLFTSLLETQALVESPQALLATSLIESNPITEATSAQMVSPAVVTETNPVTESIMTQQIATPVAGSPGGVRLLIQDVYYPTIRSDQIKIDRTANDPISNFSFVLQDDPSYIALSELQEVVFLDAGLIGNPTHNLLQNPVISPYTSNWTLTSSTGGTITQQSPGVQIAANNLTGSMNLSQLTNNGLIVAGQTYMLSCWIQSTLTNANQAFLQISYLNASGTVLVSQNLTLTTSVPTQYSLSLQAPLGSVTAQVEFGIFPQNGTNGGAATFWNIQFEPMSFTTGTTQQYYPTPFCANGQTNCTLMPDGTTIRQFRLFGGYITKATAGNYIGNNRQWTVQVSSYAWLLQKQLLNDSFSNQTDSYILKFLINKYFPGQFNVSQIVTGATLDMFGYTYNGTMREAINNLSQNAGYYFYVDAYRAVSYQPPGYNLLAFQLSDNPDNMTSFPYYGYSLDIDGTQLGNAVLVTGATNISAVEYDPQSIGYYNQKTGGQGIFWRTVNDSTIASNAAARSRAIAELATYAYAQQIVHLTTNQHMIPGNSVFFSSRTDQILQQPLLIQKASVLLKGFTSLGTPYYEFQCDLGAWQPDAVSITVKLLRKQLTNANNIGTPVIGLLATETTTFVDAITVKIVVPMPATYGTGTYGTSTYGATVPGVPTTQYGVGVWDDPSKGYN